jgi:archaemetzincin
LQPTTINITDQALLDLIPFGEIDPLALSVLAANLQAVVGLPTRIRPARPHPDDAFIPTRYQFDAVKVVNALGLEVNGALFRMGVIQRDLCVPILTYVYGESQLGGHAAVISFHRLHHIDHQVTCERGAKIAIHEAGHLLGLEHCREPGCLMRFSKQLDQLDLLPMRFCPACEYEIARLLKKAARNRHRQE